MDKARYLVEAHVLEGRSVGELAAAHGVHPNWIYKMRREKPRSRFGGISRMTGRYYVPRPSRTTRRGAGNCPKSQGCF